MVQNLFLDCIDKYLFSSLLPCSKTLSEEQNTALERMQSTRDSNEDNQMLVLLTGEPGAGKSVLANAMSEKMDLRVKLTATTWFAASHIGTQPDLKNTSL